MTTKKNTALFAIAGCLIGIFVLMMDALLGLWGMVISVGLGVLILATVLLWQYPYWALVFLIIFIPTESFVLKFVPGPEQIYAASQFIGEALVYLLFAVALVKRFLAYRSIRKTFIDIPFLIFIAGAAISIATSRAPLAASLLNVRSAVRYVALFYAVSNLNLSQRQVSGLIKTLLAMGAVEILIGAIQLMGGARLYLFFAPRPGEVGAEGGVRSFILLTRGRELGSIFGTLGDTLYFGLFMLIVLALYLSRIKKITLGTFGGIALIILAIGFSYSRASLLAAILMIIVWYVQFHGLRVLQVLIAGSALLIVFVLALLGGSLRTRREYINPRMQQQNILRNITSAFTKEYVSAAQSNRLGMLIWVPPVVARNVFWFGYGPDQTTTIERLNETDIPRNYKFLRTSGFEDVYWVAMFAYYGIVGALAFVAIFAAGLITSWNVFKKTKSALTREVSIAVYCTWALAPFLLFFYRALEFRAYSFFLWLLPALMINMVASERQSAFIAGAWSAENP